MKTTSHSLTTMKHTASLLAAALLGLAMNERAFAGADMFSNATEITASNTYSSVSLLSFTSQPTEPGHKINGTKGAEKTAWWKWTAPSDGFCTVDTIGQFNDQFVYDTILAVYTGNSTDSLTRVAAGDTHATHLNYGSAGAASATFYATEGTTYRIAVDGYNAASVNANNHNVVLRLRHLQARVEHRIAVFGVPEDDFMHGIIQVSKTAGHAFSGKMIISGVSHPFKGVFGVDGHCALAIERKRTKGAPPQPPLTLLLDGAGKSEFALVSHLYSGGWHGMLETREVFPKGQESGLKGRYSAVVRHKSFGNWRGGVMSLAVSGAGMVKGAAVLPDGTKMTFGSVLCEKDASSSRVPFYGPLYKNQGYITAQMNLTEGGAVDQVTTENLGSLHFRPAAPGATFMPDGNTFYFGVDIKGATYTPPAAKARALGFLEGSMGAGQLSIPMDGNEVPNAIMENLTLDTGNKLTFASKTRKPVLTLNKSTGIATGYIHDDAGKKRSLTGVLFMDGMTPKLHGHVSGATKNVFFEVIP